MTTRRPGAPGEGWTRSRRGAPGRRTLSKRPWWGSRSRGDLLLIRGTRAVLGRRLLGRAAREREEDLVEAWLAQREPCDRDAVARELGDRLGRPLGVRRTGGRQSCRVGLEVDPRGEGPREDALGLRSMLGVQQPHVQGAPPDRRLELARRPFRDHLPVV